MNIRTDEQAEEAAKKIARAEFWLRLVSIVLATMLVGALATIVVLVGQVRATQLEGTPTGQKLLDSAERIQSCTEPQGKCYKQNQKRTEQVVENIGKYIVLAAACAAEVDTELANPDDRIAQITKCVAERL
jgi:hypothetical protein